MKLYTLDQYYYFTIKMCFKSLHELKIKLIKITNIASKKAISGVICLLIYPTEI